MLMLNFATFRRLIGGAAIFGGFDAREAGKSLGVREEWASQQLKVVFGADGINFTEEICVWERKGRGLGGRFTKRFESLGASGT